MNDINSQPNSYHPHSQNNSYNNYSNKPVEAVDLSEYFQIILSRKWLVLVTTFIFVILGVIVALILPPKFKTHALIQIEEESAGLGVFEDLMLNAGGGIEIAADIQIIKSSLVIEPTVRNLYLDIEIEPAYLTPIGAAMARGYQGIDSLAEPFMGLSSFAWGGESLIVSVFEVPRRLQGLTFSLVAISTNQYKLLDDKGKFLFKGTVGELEQFSIQTKKPFSISIKVDEFIARNGTEFFITKKNINETIDSVSERLKIVEKGANSGVLEVSLSSTDPEMAMIIVNSILDSYIEKNINRSKTEQEKSLSFLNKQLPELKKKLEDSEQAYNDYRKKFGSVDLNVESEALLGRVIEIESQILALKQERKALKLQFKSNHPTILSITNRLQDLESERLGFEKRAEKLPDIQQEVLRLARDVKVNTELYTKLISVSQELSIAKAGTIGNAWVIDPAFYPVKAASPNKPLIVVIAFIVGIFVSLIAIVILHLRKGDTIESSEDIETYGLQVYAQIPFRKDHNQTDALSMLEDSSDITVEALRSLRASMQIGLLTAKNNILMVTGSTPGIGKSFISLNLAALFSQLGKKVLLIDADLRRGLLHEHTGLDNDIGLAELILETKCSILPTKLKNLHLLTRGKCPSNPSELIDSDRFSKIIHSLSKRFDLIVIDTPPTLSISDAPVIGRLAGLVLYVVMAGKSQKGEIPEAIKTLKHSGVTINGMVINGIRQTNIKYGYNYRYEYSVEE